MAMRSFRQSLARRMALGMLALFALVAAASVIALRSILYAQLDGTLLQIAEVEARHGAAAQGSAFAFHEGVLLQTRSGASTPLTRFAQLWTSDGRPVVRSLNLQRDLKLPQRQLERARRGEIGWATEEWNGEQIRSVVFPLELVGAAHGMHVLQVAAPTEPIRRTLWQFGMLLAGLSVLATAGTFAAGRRLAGAALRPTLEITEQAEAIGAGSSAERITAHADVREFRRLVSVLNGMLGRLRNAFESEQRFTADASHELRGPLHVLQGELEVALRRDRPAHEYRETLERCRVEVLRMGSLVQDLLVLARSDAGLLVAERVIVDLHDLARQVAERHRPIAAERGIRLDVEGRAAPVLGDPAVLERVVGNLVANAIRFSPPDGTVTIETRQDADGQLLAVRDAGPGVPPEQVPRLFTRFFRGDSARSRAETGHDQSTGLGLAIARAGAEAHGGTLRFAGNAPGAVFELRLPGYLKEL
jgi:two-component system OmpR family sensor kinase